MTMTMTMTTAMDADWDLEDWTAGPATAAEAGPIEPVFPMLGSLARPPTLRRRLQVLCALYAHSRHPSQRAALLDELERMALETAHILAVDLLENGWRPPEAAALEQRPPMRPRQRRA